MGSIKSSKGTWWCALLVGLLVLAVAGGASQAATGPAIQTITPVSADDITNLDVLRQQIRNYYGDPLGTGVFSPTSNYALEAEGVAEDGTNYLDKKAVHTKKITGKPAIVLDVDDTTLATYNYEIASDWDYNPTTNANYVNGELFPAVPGMVQMATDAAKEGYAIIYLTGRPVTQQAATVGNLTTDAMPAPAIHNGYPAPTMIFLKPAVANYASQAPWLLPCQADSASGCNTDDYKTLTRKHIEDDLGYDIVANFGDQYSDLNGGFADRTFKMPNPSYFLP